MVLAPGLEPGGPRGRGHGRRRPRGRPLERPGPVAGADGRDPGREPGGEAPGGGGAWSPTPSWPRPSGDYEAAANALLEALQQRRAQLQPETLAAVQANLEVIDRALAEVRQALAKDPSNPELSRMLVATHRKKVDVLRRVVKLSTAL